MGIIYTIQAPMWLSDTFIFRKHPDLGSVWIKVNYANHIEEVGVDIVARMHLHYDNIEDIIKKSNVATGIKRTLLTHIGDEYFWYLHNRKKLGK